MFKKILHANDGSEHAFNALSLALQIAKHDRAELHMVCVEKKGLMPELVQETVEEARAGDGATPVLEQVIRRARFMAGASEVTLHCRYGSILCGNPQMRSLRIACTMSAGCSTGCGKCLALDCPKP